MTTVPNDISDVIEADPETFEEPPSNMDANIRNLLEGVYKLDDRLFVILDLERVADLESRLVRSSHPATSSIS